MANIVEEFTIEASPQRFFNALTKPDEIVCWWFDEARVQPEVGSLGEFRFRPPGLPPSVTRSNETKEKTR
jgi:uncharacterized protein YndB with AHSA1/START domain